MIEWDLIINKNNVKVYFSIPTLFIIGDTDGHDKIVGKFASRTSNVKRLCRYCNCPYDETDNPDFHFNYNRKKDVISKIEKRKETELRNMSFHCVENAWSNIIFCDDKRGVYGATPAEIMHCFQQGLYEYIIKQLFEQKK